MVSGFGVIDYVVVLLTLALTAYFLATKPERLLLFLPAFLTIDFFIPLGSQLTPSRLVPLMIGVWALVNYGAIRRGPHSSWIAAAFIIILVSFLYAIISGDAGVRPALRALNYINLVLVFLFVLSTAKDQRTLAWAVWGLAIAGMLHGGYAAYQIVAYQTGLPFRGIVYNEFGAGAAVELAGAFRVNGLADEPKRLGYILFTAAIAAAWLLTIPLSPRQRQILQATAIGSLGVSLLTYSTSYYFVVAIWIALYFLVAVWARKMVLVAALLVVGVVVVSPSALTTISDRFSQIAEERSDEVSQGLDARFVYRQEFYAEELLKDNPILAFTGVGLGRYNRVIQQEYGAGAGYGTGGSIMPLNSQVLEVVLDFGLPGLLLIYGAVVALIWRLGWRGHRRVLVGGIVSFLAIQSVLVGNLPYLAFSMGMAAAFLELSKFRTRSGSAVRMVGPPRLDATLPPSRATDAKLGQRQHARARRLR